MAEIPATLKEVIEDFEFIEDRTERTEYLIELADRFGEAKVPERIATQPYPEENHVQQCESDAYVWAEEKDDGTLQYYFDVLNPQGLSAMAMGVVLAETLSGQPLEEVAAVDENIVFTLFGQNISMGKGVGLMGIVRMAQHEAKRRLK
ncbi:MAG: SufE family protein [Chloroflexota bacterium]